MSAQQADPGMLVHQLLERVQRLEDMLAIQKLQSRYAHSLLKLDVDRIVDECFARRSPDVSLEFSDSGVYRGHEKIRAIYRDFSRAREQIPGFFVMHLTVNPYIEISADGHSAKSHWLSPGAMGSDTEAAWAWGPYYVDYVKEDGEWRILHTNFVPVFRNRYEVSWAKAQDHGSVRRILSVPPDEPSTLYRPYNEIKTQREIFRHHPRLPQAF